MPTLHDFMIYYDVTRRKIFAIIGKQAKFLVYVYVRYRQKTIQKSRKKFHGIFPAIIALRREKWKILLGKFAKFWCQIFSSKNTEI